MAFAYVNSNSAQDDTSDNAISVTLTGVTAGNLIVLWVKYESDVNNDSTVSASDGTTSFTARPVNHHNVANDLHGAFLYLLSSVASGSVTYTVTISENCAYKWLHVREYSYTGTASFDVYDETAEGTSTQGLSGAITTTGTDGVAIGGLAFHQSLTFDTDTIGGVAATNKVGTTATSTFTADRILTEPMTTGAFTVHASGSNSWVCSIISFKAAAGGGLTIASRTVLDYDE